MTDEELLAEIRKMIDDVGTLDRVPEDELKKLEIEFPGVPQSYLHFLSVFGKGDIGNLQIYSGPISPGDVYPKVSKELRSVVLFGDDFQGCCYGFDTTRGFRVVEVSPRGDVRLLEREFRNFIEFWVAEAER